MMPPRESQELDAVTCQREEAVNLFIDGQMAFAEQSRLFAHMAECEDCRRTMGAMMEFRRMSRQESLLVPPALDETILTRLELARQRTNFRDRYWDRRPLWNARATLSLRTGAMLAVLLFGAGFLFPHETGPTDVEVPSVQVVEVPSEARVVNVLYVFYPGLTIEASRSEEPHH